MTTTTPTLLQDASRGLTDALASKPDAMMHAREAAAAISRAPLPAAGAVGTLVGAMLRQDAEKTVAAPCPAAPITDDARVDPRRSTLALCREALDMLVPGGDLTYFSAAHASALRQAVDAFEAVTTRLEIA